MISMLQEKRRILLVEDNPDDEFLARRALKDFDSALSVDVARDGVEALAYLQDDPHADLPDLVLLDLKLPRLDGFEVLRRLREDERTRDVPVVVLTTSSEGEDVRHAYNLGANSYVRKLVDFEAFFSMLRELTRYWLVWNVTPKGPI